MNETAALCKYNCISYEKNVRHHGLDNILYIWGILSTFLLFYDISVFGISMLKIFYFLLGSIIYIRQKWVINCHFIKQGYFLYYLSVVLCVIIILLGHSPYKELSLRSLINLFFIIYLSIAISSLNNKDLISFFRGVKISCIIQVFWCILQVVLWYGNRIDLNKLIFVDTFCLFETVSKYAGNILCVSGLSHHPCNLIVVIILILSLFNSSWKWIVCLFLAFFSRNTTTVISIGIAILIMLVPNIFKSFSSNRIKSKTIVTIAVFSIIPTVLFMIFSHNVISWGEEIFKRFSSIFSGGTLDGSTFAHLSYYSFLPDVWHRYTFIEIIFGYSYGWTYGMFGMFYGSDYNLYFDASIINAGVESDPMNLIYGIGIFGTVMFYSWLVKTAIVSRGTNHKYSMIIICLICCGVFYSIQFSYVILLEVALTECIRRKIDIFRL